MRADLHSRNNLMPLALLMMAAAALLPIAGSVEFAREQARNRQEARALSYASDVLHRSEETGRQIASVFQSLDTVPDPSACGLSQRLDLQRSVAATSYVKFAGVLDGGRIACSSFGEIPVQIGKPDLVTARGYQVWLNVALPFAGNERYIGMGNGRFVALVHKDLPVDASVTQEHVALASISLTGQRVFSSRGNFDARWMPSAAALPRGDHRTATVAGQIVSQVRSRTMDLAAVAALDEADFGRQWMSLARMTVPLGAATGLLLAFGVWRVASARMTLPAAIRAGLRKREFYPVFQPIVRLSDHRIVGAEALIRWRRGNGEMVPPDSFIGAAEEAGLIKCITAEMIRLVEPTLAALASSGDKGLYLALNLSPQDMQSDQTEELLEGLLARTGAAPSQLNLEITEKGFADIDHARVVVNRLRGKGLSVSIDDFGTGYSSLSDLIRLDVDTIKIDKTFVDTIDGGAATRHVAAHIVEMAHGLQLGMVAEGIERPSQVSMLRSWGVEYGQGYLFARPMSGEEFLLRVGQLIRR